jgi:hypothetical protein
MTELISIKIEHVDYDSPDGERDRSISIWRFDDGRVSVRSGTDSWDAGNRQAVISHLADVQADLNALIGELLDRSGK